MPCKWKFWWPSWELRDSSDAITDGKQDRSACILVIASCRIPTENYLQLSLRERGGEGGGESWYVTYLKDKIMSKWHRVLLRDQWLVHMSGILIMDSILILDYYRILETRPCQKGDLWASLTTSLLRTRNRAERLWPASPHGDGTFFLTQLLTRYGHFNSFLFKIYKKGHPEWRWAMQTTHFFIAQGGRNIEAEVNQNLCTRVIV